MSEALPTTEDRPSRRRWAYRVPADGQRFEPAPGHAVDLATPGPMARPIRGGWEFVVAGTWLPLPFIPTA